MGYYKKATICLNGHVASSSSANYRKFCKECGSETISLCPSCNSYIQGDYEVPGVVALGFKYNPPSYCHECGKPYPWTSTILDNAVELISLDDELPDEHKEIIKNALPDLIVETPTTPVAVAKYKKYMSSATGFIKDSLRNLLVDVVSDAVKKSLWS